MKAMLRMINYVFLVSKTFFLRKKNFVRVQINIDYK